MVLAALRAAKLECFVQKNKPMANLLKVYGYSVNLINFTLFASRETCGLN